MPEIRCPIDKQAVIGFTHQIVHHKFSAIEARTVEIGHFLGLFER